MCSSLPSRLSFQRKKMRAKKIWLPSGSTRSNSPASTQKCSMRTCVSSSGAGGGFMIPCIFLVKREEEVYTVLVLRGTTAKDVRDKSSEHS